MSLKQDHLVPGEKGIALKPLSKSTIIFPHSLLLIRCFRKSAGAETGAESCGGLLGDVFFIRESGTGLPFPLFKL